MLKVGLRTVDSHEVEEVDVLLDSGATGLFINCAWLHQNVKYFGWVASSDGVLRVFQGVDRKGLASTCKKLHPSHSLLP